MDTNNVAAQAGDEPMRAALNAEIAMLRKALEYYADPKTNAPGAVARDALAASPRATADVERDKGLEAAAALIDRKVNAYDDDMGSTDRETGAREYPGDGGEWVNEMSELAEEIRALKSVATTKPGA